MEISKKIVILLIGIIIILSIVVLYFLVITPYFQNRDLSNQQIGYDYVINQILMLLQQKGYVPINIGNNQTIYLVQYVNQSGG